MAARVSTGILRMHLFHVWHACEIIDLVSFCTEGGSLVHPPTVARANMFGFRPDRLYIRCCIYLAGSLFYVSMWMSASVWPARVQYVITVLSEGK